MKKIIKILSVISCLYLSSTNAAILDGRVVPLSCNGEEIKADGSVDEDVTSKVIRGLVPSANQRKKSLIEQLATPTAGKDTLSMKLVRILYNTYDKKIQDNKDLFETKYSDLKKSITYKISDEKSLTCFLISPSIKPKYTIPTPGGGHYESPESMPASYCEFKGSVRGMGTILWYLLMEEYNEYKGAVAKPVGFFTFDKDYVVHGDCDVNLMCSHFGTCDLISVNDMRYIYQDGRGIYKYNGGSRLNSTLLFDIPPNDNPF